MREGTVWILAIAVILLIAYLRQAPPPADPEAAAAREALETLPSL